MSIEPPREPPQEPSPEEPSPGPSPTLRVIWKSSGILLASIVLILVVASLPGPDGSPPMMGAPPPPDNATPPSATPAPDGELHILVQRVNTALGVSLECYTFYDGGLVELRHSGSRQVSDSGEYIGDASSGEILWESGRHSRYRWNGSEYVIDGAKGTVIGSCVL